MSRYWRVSEIEDLAESADEDEIEKVFFDRCSDKGNKRHRRESKLEKLERDHERKTSEGEFRCGHCHVWVTTTEYAGTHHRNHCPCCLWSKHLDLERPGDRKSLCGAGMEPVGVTFKESGFDSYGNPREGEVMLIHHCTGCNKISINRIAADDNPEVIVEVYEKSMLASPELKDMIYQAKVNMAKLADRDKLMTQLFGKSSLY